MARVTAVTIGVENFELSFVARPREKGGSLKPHLVSVINYGSNVQDPNEQIPKVLKNSAQKLAAVIFNKFRM